MKKKLQNYVFSKSEIRILKEVVDGNHSLPLLKRRLSMKPNLLSHYLKRLLKKHIIESKRKTSQKYVYFSDSKHASLLRELLVTLGHVKWENILTGLGIEILFEILDNCEITYENFSEVSFWRYSKDFMALGIVKLDDHGYSINPRFSVLIKFLAEYQRFIISTLVGSISESAVVLWQKDFKCLIRIPKDSEVTQKGFLKTATSRLHDFGIPILSDFDIYFYSKKKKGIRKEDVILHTLLIEKNNVRYVTYSLLLLRKDWRKIDREYLLKEAQGLDLGLQINAMLQFLRTKGARRGLTLPTWEEFRGKLEEYRVVD